MRIGKQALPLGVMAVGLLVLLAAIGIVMALWSKNLVVNGTVETGDLNVDWELASCSDFHNWPGPLQPGETFDKDVAFTDAVIGDPNGEPPNGFGDQVMTLTLHNAYPSYVVDCELEWINTGTIPVNFIGFSVAPGPGGSPLTGCTLTGTTTKVLACDQVTVVFVDGLNTQVDPCFDDPTDPLDQLTCPVAHSLRVHVEQPAEQSVCTATGSGDPWQIGGPGALNNAAALQCDAAELVEYQFQVKLCVAQWNETATYEECVTSEQHEGPVFGPEVDADGDGTPDFADTEGPAPNPDCTDGFDNDGDGLTDAADPDCGP